VTDDTTVSAMIVASVALATFVLVGCDAMPGRPRPAEQPVLPSHVMAFTPSMVSTVPAAMGRRDISRGAAAE